MKQDRFDVGDQAISDGDVLRLHVPEPRRRPGECANFSHLDIPQAGTTECPPVDALEPSLRGYAYGMIRVLDDEDRAVGSWNPHLDVNDLRHGLRSMALTRAFDERMHRSQRQGKTSFYVKSTGEEAVAVAQSMAFRVRDMMFTSYRQQGLLIDRGWPLVDMMCQVFNNAKDRLNGHQLPCCYSARDAGFFTVSANLGTQYPQAVGWAMASAIKRDNRIAAAWIGDGATAEGDFHYAMTFAAVYRAPVVLNIVNNQWAISSFQGIAGGEQTTFAARATGYGIPGLRVDGNDFLAVHAVTRWAARRARLNLGPTLIELYTYRVGPHSTSDEPSAYRPSDEAEQWPLGDPLERLRRHLTRLGAWSDEEHSALIEEVETEVRVAYKQAEAIGTLGSRLDPDWVFEDVFKELPPHLVQQREQLRAGG